ncbi:MAG: hypothetical protein EOP04_08515 [Proteobacteria bacterium]|nr:MAG: hypothetical protein EOP04_08515 [Pseudomonadota bacterium]
MIEGNTYSADRACLVAEQNTPQGQWITSDALNSFRSPGYEAEYRTKKALEAMPPDLAQRFKPKGKTILTLGSPCTETVEKQMCRALLGRALTDPAQANYKPGTTPKALDADTQLAKDLAEKELNTSVAKYFGHS